MHYVLVSEAPEKISQNEMVIHKPNFLEEVKQTRAKRGVNKITSISSIRDLLLLLASKYDPDLNVYRVNLVKYDNIPYSSDEDFSNIILRIIKENELNLIDKAIELQLKNRKSSVDTVYYVSDDISGTSVLIRFGFNMKDAKNSKKITSNKDSVV